jgi:hypothetical protein
MPDHPFNKYRAAIEVLQRGRDVLVEGLADEILDQGEGLTEGGYLFNEFLETQGTRLHFLTLLVSQLEQSAESLSELQMQLPERKTPVKRRTRPKKMQEQAAKKERTDES